MRTITTLPVRAVGRVVDTWTVDGVVISVDLNSIVVLGVVATEVVVVIFWVGFCAVVDANEDKEEVDDDDDDDDDDEGEKRVVGDTRVVRSNSSTTPVTGPVGSFVSTLSTVPIPIISDGLSHTSSVIIFLFY